jgi:hypothetical protein
MKEWSPNRIGIRCGAYTSAKTGRLGIYASGIDGAPQQLVLDAGEITTAASNTNYEITISITLPPGLYWLASTWASAGNSAIVGYSTVGAIGFYGRYADLQGGGVYCAQAEHTYSALPADFTTLTRNFGNRSSPTVYLRIAP